MEQHLKIGTHNSWSYLKPKYWCMYPFRFMARCQKLSIIHQYKAGTRLFDLRLYYNVNTPEFEVRHGLMPFDITLGDLRKDLALLNSNTDPDNKVHVRLILEQNHIDKEHQNLIEEKFIYICNEFVHTYQNIKFFGGNRKFDWKKVIDLGEEPLLDRYSSTTSLFKSDNWLLKIIDDWCPCIYAKLRNGRNIRKYKTNPGLHDKWLFIDFLHFDDFE